MDYRLSDLNRLQLWSLLAQGGSSLFELMRPRMDAGQRRAMVEAGLLEVYSALPTAEERLMLRKAKGASQAGPSKSGDQPGAKPGGKIKPGRASRPTEVMAIRLTAAGAARLGREMTFPLSSKALIPARLVEFLLAALADPAAQRELRERLSGAPPVPSAPPTPSAPPVPSAPTAPPASGPLTPDVLLEAIRRIDPANLMPSGGLKLSALRQALKDRGRAEVDQALLELQRRGNLVIYRFDDPSMVTGADREAALKTAGGPRHYIMWR